MDEIYDQGSDFTWPEPVLVLPPDEPVVCLSGLPKARKQAAWVEIQRLNPGLAQLLRHPDIQQVIHAFDAEIFIDARYAPSLPQERLKGRKA
jgi:hypothetical protein